MLFSDEAGFRLHPKLGRIWVKKKGNPIDVNYNFMG
jgi:hypothetical protein